MPYRRLAWHRSWAIIGFGFFVSIWSIGGLVEAYVSFRWPRDMLEWIGVIFANLVVIRIIVRGFTGSHSKRQLRVDVPAGMLQLETGELVPLDEVGEVTITKRYGGRRVWWTQVRAAGIPNKVLYESTFESETQKRFVALGEVVLQSKVRKVLERPDVGEAFRAAPDPTSEVLEVAETRERAASALTALARDDQDEAIRKRAAQLLATLP
jgi:hypothetical protein